MATIRLYLDEHIRLELARYLQRRGYDAVAALDVGLANQRVTDEDQLAFASREGRAILTHDRADFVYLDAGWKEQGREHWGIVLCPQLPISELCRRVEAHLQRYAAEDQYNLLLWC